MGVRPANSMAKHLKEIGLEKVYSVGDAVKSGTIADACHSAFDTAMKIN